MENDWFSDVTLGSNPILIWADFLFYRICISPDNAATIFESYLKLANVSCLYILFWLTINNDGIKIDVDDNIIKDTLVR